MAECTRLSLNTKTAPLGVPYMQQHNSMVEQLCMASKWRFTVQCMHYEFGQMVLHYIDGISPVLFTWS